MPMYHIISAKVFMALGRLEDARKVRSLDGRKRMAGQQKGRAATGEAA